MNPLTRAQFREPQRDEYTPKQQALMRDVGRAYMIAECKLALKTWAWALLIGWLGCALMGAR